jgi:iron complex outermembrane recepter protein
MRRMLVVGAAVSLMLAAARAPAQVQGPSASQTQDAEGLVTEVVVTGVRRSLENAIATKRDADTIVDAISAEDIGKFPTENVADSLQRVTGVQISRLLGEGQNVTIRGMPSDFTLVQLNGNTLTSALGPSGSNVSRSFDFTILPSEFVSRVEVYKTPTADLEEGGLAGTVIARTVRPLEIGQRKIAVNVEEADESKRDEWAPRASAFYSDVFADGTLGVSLGGAYTKLLSETDEQNITRYRRMTESSEGGLDLNGNGIVENGQDGRPLNRTPYAVVDSIFQSLYRENSERKTVMGTVQFRPTDHWELVADSFYGKLDLFTPRLTDLVRIGIGLLPGGPIVRGSQTIDQRPGNSSPVGDNGQPVNTLETAEFQGVDERADGRTEARNGDLASVALSSVWHSDNGLRVRTGAGFSEAKQVMYNPLEENMRRADVAYNLDTNSDLVSYHYLNGDDAARMNPATYTLLSLNGEWGQHRRDEQSNASFDVDKDLEWGWLDSLQGGGRYTLRSVYQDNLRIQATSTQLAPLWNGGAPQLFLVPVHPSSGEFLDAAGPTAGLFPQTWLANDPWAFINHYGFQRVQSLSTITNDPTGIYDVREHDSAVYLRANIASPGGRLTGNVGVRVVHTQQISVGVSPDLNDITFQPQAGSITTVPAAGLLTVNRSYNDVLPSLNLKLDVTDRFLMRLAASRTMSRPTLTQLSPTVSASGPAQTITENNPYLAPFRSNNLDLTGEWYFAPGGLLATTLFYKDLVSLVIQQQTQVPLTITQINGDGSRQPVQQVWTESSLVNGHGIRVDGAEFSYQQNFDFLPRPLDGLGVLLNYTWLESHGSTPLQGTSKNNYTAQIYYEKGRFGGRLAYTYRGEFYVGTEGNTQDQIIQQPFGTLDGNVTFNLTDHVSLLVEATNILEDTDRQRFEPINLTASYIDNGRRVLVGVRGTF